MSIDVGKKARRRLNDLTCHLACIGMFQHLPLSHSSKLQITKKSNKSPRRIDIVIAEPLNLFIITIFNIFLHLCIFYWGNIRREIMRKIKRGNNESTAARNTLKCSDKT